MACKKNWLRRKKKVENIWKYSHTDYFDYFDTYETSVYFAYWNRDENIFSNVNIIPRKIEIRKR